MLSYSVTKELLKKIKPMYIFSGDNHDYCKYIHENASIEVNIKIIFFIINNYFINNL